MKIDNSNYQMISSDDVHLHDDIFINMTFNRKTDTLSVMLIGHRDENSYVMHFCNVVGFSMTACDFWGRSPHILDFEYVASDDQEILPRLKQMQVDGVPQYKLRPDTAYFETLMTFTSGDNLRVACEYLRYNE